MIYIKFVFLSYLFLIFYTRNKNENNIFYIFFIFYYYYYFFKVNNRIKKKKKKKKKKKEKITFFLCNEKHYKCKIRRTRKTPLFHTCNKN